MGEGEKVSSGTHRGRMSPERRQFLGRVAHLVGYAAGALIGVWYIWLS